MENSLNSLSAPGRTLSPSAASHSDSIAAFEQRIRWQPGAKGMIASMAPQMSEGRYIFCSTADPATAAICAEQAISTFIEEEGDSFILPLAVAKHLSFDCALPMRMITLAVHSALDGLGLTAAVASELDALGIPCNVVAAHHHDHVFVPEKQADRALSALKELQKRARLA